MVYVLTNTIVQEPLVFEVNNNELYLPFRKQTSESETRPGSGCTPSGGETTDAGSAMQREARATRGFTPRVIDTIIDCRRPSSNKLYSTYVAKWRTYCERLGSDPLSPSISQILNYLQSLRDDPATHRGYSAICTARAALSSFLDNSLVDNKFVKQFLRGVYNQNPPKTRYAHIWDPRTVLDVLSGPSWTPASQLDLLQLTKKTVFLILITSGQRGQIIPALSLENMEEQEDGFVFKIDTKFLKQGRPGYRPGLLSLLSYEDWSICVATYLKEYLARTNDLRKNTDKVFLTIRKPYKPVSRDTVSRWVK